MWLADAKDWLAGTSATLMDEQLQIQLAYSQYFLMHRNEYKSDNALRQSWYALPAGKRQLEIETEQRRIKVLREAISSHLRVASDAARNLY
jgi:hypothetical protein